MNFLEKIAKYPDAHGFLRYICELGLLDKVMDLDTLYGIYCSKGHYSRIVEALGAAEAADLVQHFTKNSVPYFLKSIDSVEVADMYIRIYNREGRPKPDDGGI